MINHAGLTTRHEPIQVRVRPQPTTRGDLDNTSERSENRPMNPLAKLVDWLRPKPQSAEDILGKQEADRLRDEMQRTRLATKYGGDTYETQGRRRDT